MPTKARIYRDRYWRYNQSLAWILEGRHSQGDHWIMRFNSFEQARRYIWGYGTPTWAQ